MGRNHSWRSEEWSEVLATGKSGGRQVFTCSSRTRGESLLLEFCTHIVYNTHIKSLCFASKINGEALYESGRTLSTNERKHKVDVEVNLVLQRERVECKILLHLFHFFPSTGNSRA